MVPTERDSDKTLEDQPTANATDQLASQAEESDLGFLAEFWLFLRDNKKWWLIPLLGSLLLIGVVSLLASSAAAPWIYTLF